MIADTWATSETPVGLDLYYDGAWQDITEDLSKDGIEITRGRSAEGQTIDPSEMSCSLLNIDGTYSPRNPLSPLFGLIARNTPVRFWVRAGEVRDVQPTYADYWSAPDSAALSITGDIDLRGDLDLDSWRPSTTLYLGCRKAGSWGPYLGTDGTITCYWSANGTDWLSLTSTAPVPVRTGRLAWRVTLDVDNGASGHTVTFYTAESMADSWVQLGDPVVGAGTTSIYDSTDALTTRVGQPAGSTTAAGIVSIYEIQVRNGIGGSLVANPVFTSQTSGTSTFADTQTNTWTASGDALATDRHYRFWGEVVSWPQEWGKTGSKSAYTPITCAGVSRRIDQGESPQASPLRRALPQIGASLVGYWPMEDDAGATVLETVQGRPMRVRGAPTLAGYDGFAASEPIAVLASGGMHAATAPHTATGYSQVRFITRIPSGTTDGLILAKVWYEGGTVRYIDVRYNTASGGTINLLAYDSSFTYLGGLTAALGVDGKNIRLSVELTQDGADIDWAVLMYEVGASAGYYVNGTLSSKTFGRAASIFINPNLSDFGETAIGHATVETAITSLYDVSISVLIGHSGEEAHARIERLGGENEITVGEIGYGEGSQALGPQSHLALSELFDEAAEADGGMLYEPRDSMDLRYRTLRSVSSQRPALSIPYLDNLLDPFKPIDDDQRTRNKIKVTRAGGGSFTEELTTGAMSTQPPPDGVGVYDQELTLCLATDRDAEQQATWRVHVGTVDEARWPKIGIELANPTFKGDLAQTRRILDLDLGDRLVVTGLPDWLPPDDVSVIVQGYTEVITPRRYAITLNCTPESPYKVVTYADGVSRYSAAGTVTRGPLTGYQATFAGASCLSVDGDDPASDNDVRVRVALTDWTPGTEQCLAAKYVNTGNQRSWAFDVATSGSLHLYLSTDGSSYTGVTSTAATGFTDGTYHWVRWTRVASTGVVKFYGSDDGESWSQIGADVASGVTGTLHASTGLYQAGARSGTSVTSPITGVITAVQVLDGVGGTTLVPLDPSGWTDGYSGSGTGTVTTAQAATDVPVTVPAGLEWTDDDGEYDFMVDGETMTVTAVSAVSGTDQTLTVDRSINGIVKSHVTGVSVNLAEPYYWGS